MINQKTILKIFCLVLLMSCSNQDKIDPIHTTPSADFSSKTSQPTSSVEIVTPTRIDNLSSFSLIPTTIQNSGAWNFIDPKNQSLPELIIAEGNGYRLQSNWSVQAITLFYNWSSFESITTYQTVRLEKDIYKIEETVIEDKLVDNLVESINSLQPSPNKIFSVTHPDDYHHWRIELIGKDGNRILLFSDSNTDFSVPWNIFYNGRLYVTWNEDILLSISQLFSIEKNLPLIKITYGEEEDFSNNLPLTSSGQPNQIYQGFSGLLPISNRFQYTYNSVSKIIEGKIDNQYPIYSFDSRITGNIVGISEIKLTIDSGVINCPIVYDDSRNSLDVLVYGETKKQNWLFTCSLKEVENLNYQTIPISITFVTDIQEYIITRGELYGFVDNYSKRLILPLTENFSSILLRNLQIKDLMSDHILQFDIFDGDININQDNVFDGLTGKVNLYGQIYKSKKIIPYVITTQIVIDDQQVMDWDLDRNKLIRFLDIVLQSSFVERVLLSSNSSTLHLFYSELPNIKLDMPYNEAASFPNLDFELPGCSSLYTGRNLPNRSEPLRGFGFGQSSKSYIQFLLVDNKIIPVSLFLSPYSTDSNLLSILTPKELLLDEDVFPFGRIDTHNSRRFFPDNQAIFVKWDSETIKNEDILAYNDKIESLSLPFEILGDNSGYRLNNAIFYIDGENMSIKLCN